MEKQRKYPQLRFNKFNGEWRIKTINQLVEEKIIAKPIDGNHGNIHPKATDYVPTGIPFIMACNIKDGDIDLINCKFIKKEQADKLQKGFARRSDVLLTHKGSIGEVTIVPENVYDYIMLTPQVTYYRVLNHALLINTYLRFYFNSSFFQKQLKLYSDSGTRPYIGITEQRNLYISLPILSEQQKIASFFTGIDQKISQLKQKKTLLEQYKKGVMQKIFSQEIRFRDVNGQEFPTWEKKELGEFLMKHDEKATESNQYPVLTSARTGIYFQKDYFDGNDVASKDNTGYNVVPRNFFTYRHMSDDLIFRFNTNTICEKGIVSTLYPVFTTKNINDKFLQVILNEGIEFRRYALEQKQGGSRTYMYFSKLIELILTLPCLTEQNLITNFLSAMDDKIKHTQKQIEKAEVWKKGLMQQMFV
jgi:type I restriction enzyme S subunit